MPVALGNGTACATAVVQHVHVSHTCRDFWTWLHFPLFLTLPTKLWPQFLGELGTPAYFHSFYAS